MGLTARHYIFQEDGALKRVPRRIMDGLPFGADAIPAYAGTRQRHAEVLVENEDGRPVRILDVIGTFWDFDDQGRIDEALHEASGEWINFAFSTMARNKTDGPVVDLVPELKRKELHKRHRWTVTKDELDLIAADIWPGINGPAPEIDSVKGKAPKRSALSQSAKRAMSEIGTGRGDWYTVLEVARADRDKPYLWEQVCIAHAKGASRKEAVEAGRRLMAEKAEWLDADIEVSITLRSALEWQPEED